LNAHFCRVIKNQSNHIPPIHLTLTFRVELLYMFKAANVLSPFLSSANGISPTYRSRAADYLLER